MQLILLFTFLVLADLQSPSAWRGIVPLHSSRADVEQLLGPPSKLTGSTFYDFAGGSVFVVYAVGPPCGEHGENEWRVPHDTVISLTVYSKRKPKFSERRLDMKKYKKTGGGHLPDVFYYVNEEDGIKIEVVQGRVDAITYFPAAKDDHLHCPRINAAARDVRGELSPKEKELLDALILRLTQEPQVMGLILIDFERKRVGEFKLGERIMDYLKSKHASEFGRIKLMEMGRLKNEMELFIMPSKGKLIPFP